MKGSSAKPSAAENWDCLRQTLNPRFGNFLVFVLVVIQAISWLGLAGAFMIWLIERNTQLLLDSAIT